MVHDFIEHLHMLTALELIGLSTLASIGLHILFRHIIPLLVFVFQMPPPKVTVEMTEQESADVLKNAKKMALNDFNSKTVKLFDPSTCDRYNISSSSLIHRLPQCCSDPSAPSLPLFSL